jgi:Arrestin (or S-antigen), C-terminal domain
VSTAVDLSVQLPGASFIEGSTVDATVRATAEGEVVVEGGRVELVRTLTYRYTAWSPYASPITIPARDAKVIRQAHFHPTSPLVEGRPLVQPVTLDIPPDGPGSVQTELVEIGWAVRARLHMARSRDAEVTRPIVVLSQARDCARVAQAPPVLEDQGCAVLGLESVSSRRLVPGVPLSGVLTVAPLQPASARGIRLELVLLEHVLHGPRLTDDPARNPAHEDKYADTVVASVPLAEHVRLDPSRPLRFEFTVPVPPQLPAPTMRTPNFTLSWMLRGVVDRQLHRDPCVAVELQAVTTHNEPGEQTSLGAGR